jgi:hypothetical protein
LAGCARYLCTVRKGNVVINVPFKGKEYCPLKPAKLINILVRAGTV